MKFAKYLAAESVPEWREKYIDYKLLKKLLKRLPKQAVGSLPPPKRPLTRLIIGARGASSPRTSSPLSSIPITEQDITNGSGQHSNSRENFERQSTALLDAAPPRKSIARSPSTPIDTATLDLHLSARPLEEREFFKRLDEEVEKVNKYFIRIHELNTMMTYILVEKEKEATKRFNELTRQIALYEKSKALQENKPRSSPLALDIEMSQLTDIFKKKRIRRPSTSSSNKSPTRATSARAGNDDSYAAEEAIVKKDKSRKWAYTRLKRAFQEFYRSVELLKNYRILNYTAVCKILKKFDKTVGWNSTRAYLKKVDITYFQSSKELERLLAETENIYTKTLAKGKRHEAMRKLRVPDIEHQTNHSVMLRSGCFLGFSIPLVLYSIIMLSTTDNSNRQVLMHIYSGFSVFSIFLLCFSVNLYVWFQNRINYKFIFEFDPRDNLHYHQFFELASIVFLLWSISVYLSISDLLGPIGISPEAFPMTYFVLILCFILNPFPIIYRSARMWLVRTLLRIVSAPFFRVEFRDFFIADQLNSLTNLFVIFDVFCCAYANNFDSECTPNRSIFTPLLAMLPSYWRLCQCLRRYKDTRRIKPHIVNAGKYLSSLALVWVSYKRKEVPALFIVAAIISSIYGYVWDIYMDWGLLQTKNGLRQVLIYSWKWSYYWAMVSDFFLRLTWIVLAAYPHFSTFDIRIVTYILAIVEMLRRVQWNFFRLENEHTNNCGQFRAVKEVPLPFEVLDDDIEEGRSVQSESVRGEVHDRLEYHPRKLDDENRPKSAVQKAMESVLSMVGVNRKDTFEADDEDSDPDEGPIEFDPETADEDEVIVEERISQPAE